MKKSRILLLSLSMIVAILNFTGCSDGLTHLVFWDSYYIGVNDLNISRENWYITQAIERFENEHPNVRIDYEIVAHSSETIKKFEMACEAKTGPDIVTLWSSSYAAQVKDYLLPLDSYISEEERNVITGWDTVQFDGVTYGYPTNDSGLQVIYYNKSLIKSAGLDFEKAPPIVFDEFYQACSTLKANDVTPLLISYKEGGTDAAIISYWFGQMVDAPQTFYDMANGITNFHEQSAFINAARAFREVYTRGYTNVDVLTADEPTLTTRFLNNEGAMIIGNTWYIDVFTGYEDQIGIIPLPNMSSDANIKGTGTGGPGLLLGVSQNSTQKELALEFVKFLMSRNEMIEFCSFSKKALPNRTDIEATMITNNAFLLRHAELKKNGYVVWLDNVLPPIVCDTWFQNAPLYFTNKLNDEEYLNRLDSALNLSHSKIG